MSLANRIIKGAPPDFDFLHFDLHPPCSTTIFNGLFHMLLIGPSSNTVVVEASANLKAWTPIQTNTMPRGGLVVAVPLGTNHINSSVPASRRIELPGWRLIIRTE